MHILPEAVEDYTEKICKPDERCFPWPYFAVFCGYSMILLIDKVAFDSHDLFTDDHNHGDPAAMKLMESQEKNRLSISAARAAGDKKALRKSMAQQ